MHIERKVNNINTKLVFTSRFDDANTLGIIKKIVKGFSIPPVR